MRNEEQTTYQVIVQTCEKKFFSPAGPLKPACTLIIIVTPPGNCCEKYPYPADYIEAKYRSCGYHCITKVPTLKNRLDTIDAINKKISEYCSLMGITRKGTETDWEVWISEGLQKTEPYEEIFGIVKYSTDLADYFKPKYPVAYTAVDVIVYCKETNEIVLGYKGKDDVNCLIGGFVDPEKDGNYEQAAKRELLEETHLDFQRDLHYANNLKVADWRYEGSKSKIFTTVYIAEITKEEMRTMKPGDDIKALFSYKVKPLKEKIQNHSIKLPVSHAFILSQFIDSLTNE